MPLEKQDLSKISRYVRDSIDRLPPRPVKAATIGTLSGAPTTATPPSGDSSQRIATTEFVQQIAQTIPKITTSAMSGGPPASPNNGDIWIATAVDANGTRWQFQYDAGSSSAYKWEFIGGPKVQIEDTTAAGFTSNSVWIVDSGLGSIAFPRGGEYFIGSHGYFTASASGAQTLQFGWWFNGAFAGVALDAISIPSASYDGDYSFERLGAVAQNATIALAMWNNSASAFTMGYRDLFIVPRRIS